MSRYLGIDYGSKRVGLAISDPSGMLASPLGVVSRRDAAARVAEIVAEHFIDAVVVGLPVGLSGREGTSAAEARHLGAEIAEATGLPVVFSDERFSTRMAEDALLGAGMKRRRRRDNVDQAAAVIILQGFLDRLAKREPTGNSDAL